MVEIIQTRQAINELSFFMNKCNPTIKDEGLNLVNKLLLCFNETVPMCRAFKNNKLCKYGNYCRYRHFVLPTDVVCKNGNNCYFNRNGKCRYLHLGKNNDLSLCFQQYNNNNNHIHNHNHVLNNKSKTINISNVTFPIGFVPHKNNDTINNSNNSNNNNTIKVVCKLEKKNGDLDISNIIIRISLWDLHGLS